MGTVCWTHNRRNNRREHKYDLRIFCRHHPSRAENEILWMGECSCRSRNYYWTNSWGLLAKFGHSVPLYFRALITLLNVLYGMKYMPESLHKNNRLKEIVFVRLNPFAQLANILSMKNLTWLLVSAFLLWIPNGSLQAIFTQFTMDTFSWQPALIGLMFSIMGFQDIISQAFIMPKLLIKLSDKQIAILGMVSEIIGYSFIAASALFSLYPLLIVGMLLFGFGDSIFGPSFNGMLSKSVSYSEQGRIQGGSQSIQALARMIGPIIGDKSMYHLVMQHLLLWV